MNNLEKTIVAKYGKLTPPKILRYFIDDTFFKTEHEKRPYTFIVMGRSGQTGKTWLTFGLKRYGLKALELSESIFGLVDYRDCENHVIADDLDRTIIVVLNKHFLDERY